MASQMSTPQTSLSTPSKTRTPPSIITLVLMAGVSVMSMNVFLPVLPLIGTDLGVSDATAQYVLTIFLASTAIAQLFVGPLSDRFGRRPVMLVSLVIFMLSSVVCLFAPNIETLLVGRIFQASTAASMTLTRAIIRDLYDREKAASMIGYVTMAMAIIPMIAPSIGGFVGELVGWRGPFAILLATAIAMFILVYVDLGETHTPNDNSIAEQLGDYWSLLKEPAVWGYFSIASLASGAYFAFLGAAPFVGLKLIGMGPGKLGLYFAIIAIGYMAGNFITGRYSEKIGIEKMMLYGSIVAAVGVTTSLYLMTNFEPQAIFLFGPMALVGAGNGMTLANAAAGAISVRPDLAGSASGLGGFLQIGSGAILASLSGALISVENLAVPLYIIMLVTSLSAALISAWMFKRARRVQPAH